MVEAFIENTIESTGQVVGHVLMQLRYSRIVFALAFLDRPKSRSLESNIKSEVTEATFEFLPRYLYIVRSSSRVIAIDG